MPVGMTSICAVHNSVIRGVGRVNNRNNSPAIRLLSTTVSDSTSSRTSFSRSGDEASGVC